MIRRFFYRLGGWLEVVLACVACFVVVGFFFKMLAGFWPVTTGLFFLFGTVGALEDDCRTTKTMCVGGIIIYALGWVASWIYGPIFGSALCAIGFMLWFQAGVRAYWGPFMDRRPASC